MNIIQNRRVSNFQTYFYFIFGFFFIQIFDLFDLELLSFIIKNIYLILFLTFNVITYKKRFPHRWLLNPVVLASILTFLLGYSLSSFTYFIPDSEDQKQMYQLLGYDSLYFFNKTLDLIILAAFTMWIGYYSQFGIKLYNLILRFPINFRKYFRLTTSPNLFMIYVIIIISIIARLYAIELGIYGFSQTPEKLSASIGIANTLLAIGEIITLCLLIVSYAYFKERHRFEYKITFYIILVSQIFFGILSGMKSAVVIPFLLAFTTYYLVNNKINKTFIVATFLFIIIAYIIIEPFRIIKSRDINFQSTPTNIALTMIDAYNINQQRRMVTETENIFTSVISRNAYLLNAAKAIQYQDTYGLGILDPDFAEKLYTIPLQTFIPRLFWADKPIEDFGKWFSVRVWGSTASSAVAITPFGFLYFAGGWVFIAIGFFIFGIMQRTLWQFYLAGGGQLLIFLAFLSTVVMVDSSVNGTIVYWLRYFPVFIFLQTLIFKKTKNKVG